MARIRSVHPGFFTDEKFVTLSAEAQIFMIGVWTEADDQGVFAWKPLGLRMRLRPASDGAVDALLDELVAADCVCKFQAGGRSYGAVRNFRKYQRPKKPNAVHPLPEALRAYVGLSGSEPTPADDPGDGETPAQREEEGEGDKGREGEKTLSDESDDAVPKIRSGRKTYPESFEAFWRDYPTDPIMSKTRTFAQWRRLSPEDQQAAHEAVPGFRAYCRRAPTYRPVHAERFLSQRRFDGFKAGTASDKTLYREHWNGEAARLLDAVGAGEFHAWFADAVFAPGPPPRLILASVFRRDHVEGKFGALLRQLYGDIGLEVAP